MTELGIPSPTLSGIQVFRAKIWARTQVFFTIYVALYTIAIMLQIYLPSYLTLKSSQMLSFLVEDGWCDPATQGIGAHCFGDFYSAVRFANLDSPWSDKTFPWPLPMPPLDLFILKPFRTILSHSSVSRTSLFLYLALCIVSVLIPAIHARVTRRLSNFQAVALGAFSLLAAPVLMSIDRGNNQLLIIPLLYFFLLGALEARSNRMFFIGVLLVLFKPQMIVLGGVFLIHREWKLLFRFTVVSLSLFLGSFLLYPINFFGNIRAFIAQLTAYQSYSIPGQIVPVNLSLPNFWSWLQNNSFFHIHSNPSPTYPYYSIVITFLIFALVGVNLVLFGRRRRFMVNVLIILMLPILLPSTTYAYYLCILVPVAILVFADGMSHTSGSGTFIRSKQYSDSAPLFMLLEKRYIAISLAITFYLLFIPWAIPWSLFSKFHSEPWSFIGINWIFGQISLVLLFFLLLSSGVKSNRRRLSTVNKKGTISQ
ncbi:MAG: hypothetical protein NTX12_01835 [Actinobacteria bacterium]|nr:hypothetical protein [Actinomycetota bacterium]